MGLCVHACSFCGLVQFVNKWNQTQTNMENSSFKFKWAWLLQWFWRHLSTVFCDLLCSCLPHVGEIASVRHFFPLDLVFVTWTVLPTTLQYVGQGKQGLSVVLEAARSRRRLAGQQGHHPTPTTPALCKIVHTQRHRERMGLPWGVCYSHPPHLTQTICACQLPVFPGSHTGIIPKPSSGSMRD